MRVQGICFAVIGILAASAATAQAVPINLLQNYPDIQVSGNVVNYNAATQQFSATGRPLTYTTAVPTVYNITGTTPTYSLVATVNNAGVATGGTLAVSGKIASLGATSGSLLTGVFQSFGYSTASNADPFEFIFTVTGGDLASAYGGIGGKIGVILDAKSTNFAGFSASFTNGSGATNDTFHVPEPATCCLLALAGVIAYRRRGTC